MPHYLVPVGCQKISLRRTALVVRAPLCNIQWGNAGTDAKIDETSITSDGIASDFFLWLSIHKYLQENRSVGSSDHFADLNPVFGKKLPIQTFFLQRLSYPTRHDP